MENKLKLLGLNLYQSKAYLTLVKLGKSKALTISQEAKVPHSKIYEVLDSLEKLELIYIIPEDIKHYAAKPIKFLKNLLHKKQKELALIDKEIDNLKQIEDTKSNGGITVVRGNRNLYKVSLEKENPKTFSYAIRFEANADNRPKMRDIKQLKDKIDNKIIYDFNTPVENIESWKDIYPTHKYINSPKVAVDINDTSTLIVLKDLASAILIESVEFSKVMKQLFESHYKNNWKQITKK